MLNNADTRTVVAVNDTAIEVDRRTKNELRYNQDITVRKALFIGMEEEAVRGHLNSNGLKVWSEASAAEQQKRRDFEGYAPHYSCLITPTPELGMLLPLETFQ